MKINVRTARGVRILDVMGKITLHDDYVLVHAVTDSLNTGLRNILINLNHTSTIDSSGMGQLAHSYTMVANAGGKLKLLSVPSTVLAMLQAAGLDTAFERFDDESAAISSF